jgi:RNA polymerase sigma-70 factor (ECF subfamily)
MDFRECLRRVRDGDRSALEELFARWRPLLHLQARRMLGAELSARVDPSDVVQEACTQAFQDLAQFRGQSEGEWVAWLRTLVTGQAAMSRRRHFADKRDPQREQAGIETADVVAGPVQAAIDHEQAARLATALAALPPDMREVVLRRVFEREPFEVVAQTLGRSPGAARVLWTRSLRRLRQLLDESSGSPVHRHG